MPELKMQLPQTPNTEWKDAQFRFDGAWKPDVDGALIGPNNYQTLENLRYRDSGLEGINGYTRVNITTPLEDPTDTRPLYLRIGHQLRTDKAQSSYVLVHGIDAGDSDQGYVHVNRTAIHDQGDFDTTSRFTVDGDPYHTDASPGLTGRFSDAPQGNIGYANGEETMIFGGDEQRVAAAFSVREEAGAEVIAAANDRTVTVAHGWTNNNVNTWDGVGGDISATASASGQWFSLPQVNAPTVVGTRYELHVDITNLVGTWTVSNTAGTDDYGVITANGTQIALAFQATTTGGIRITSNETNSSADFDNFSMTVHDHADEIDITDRINNTLHADNPKDMFTVNAADRNGFLVCTTRPIQAVKIYVDSANLNAAASTLQCGVWDGTGYTDNIINTDGTSSGGVALAQTGVVAFTSHTDGTAMPHHEQALYLYTYYFQLSGGDADIYYITVDPAFQTVKDVWDGVYRQPIQFQRTDGTSYFDYTLQVNESSSLDAPIGAEVGQMTTAGSIYMMFEDQITGIQFTMLGDLVNTADVTGFVLKYWDGDAYTAVTQIDDDTGTGDDGAGKLFGSTGLVQWTPESDEQARTLFGSFGYVYELSFSGGGPLSGSTPDAVLIDLCTAIPTQKIVLPFDWTALFGTRLVAGGYTQGDEGNRMDYSVANAPDAWNGFDSSDGGKQSLYFGGVEPIVGATQIYNRFGAAVLSMLLVLKKGEVYIVIGDTPEDFTIYPVAQTIGCVAPKTLATAEIGLDLGQGLTRNVAIWLSHSGPVMFDGAVLTEINGIKSYFDAVDDRFINFDYIENAVGWVDPNYKEYNLLIPSGVDATKNNAWLVYDLRRKKWYEKTTGGSETPQMGFELGDRDTGERHIHGGIDTGYMVHLEEGTTWGDALDKGITQRVKSGDFFPSGNVWDETLIRKFKIFIKRLTGSQVQNTLSIKYFTNTEELADNGVIWQDSELGSGIAVDWANSPDEGVEWDSGVSATINLAVGLQRIVKVNHDLSRLGWAHAFEFILTTSDVNKGFQPIIWGIQYRVERKDNTASAVTTL